MYLGDALFISFADSKIWNGSQSDDLFKSKIDELMSKIQPKLSSSISAENDLEALLNSLQLSSMHDKLVDEGITTVDDLRDVSEKEMVDDLDIGKFKARKLYKYLHGASSGSTGGSVGVAAPGLQSRSIAEQIGATGGPPTSSLPPGGPPTSSLPPGASVVSNDDNNGHSESQSGSVFRMNTVDPKLKRTDADIYYAVNVIL